MPDDFPDFRLGSVLATSFTGTLSERHGESVERIPTPGRLADWLAINDLAVGSCTPTQLARAKELREAIHLALTATAIGETPGTSAVEVINDCSSRGHATAFLSATRTRQWQLGSKSAVRDALGVIAADAIDIIAGEQDGKLALCGSPTCLAAFFDTSQSRTRRWCDMNTCGNRAKKARFNAGKRRAPSDSH